MPSVILLEKDPFTELDQRLQDEPYSGENFNVRRPIYGMTPKDPRFAYLSVYQDLGRQAGTQVVSILDSSAPGGFSEATHNFILQGITESRQEKVQIIETFGDHFAFFYGQKPIVLQVSGMLFNSYDFNWKNEFLDNYERRLRGTKCVENRSRVFLGWDDVLAQGYILNVQVNYNSDIPLVVPFTFSMLLSKPPLDLSKAGAALESPEPGLSTPWTYRTLESATAGVVPPFLPEYLTDTKQTQLVALDPADGEALVESGASGDVASTTDSGGLASWVNGVSPGSRQWRDTSEALLLMNLLLTQQQAGVDRVTAARALKANPASLQATTRPVAKRSAESFSPGVTNTAFTVGPPPVVEPYGPMFTLLEGE